jgi:hypothetical protein
MGRRRRDASQAPTVTPAGDVEVLAQDHLSVYWPLDPRLPANRGMGSWEPAEVLAWARAHAPDLVVSDARALANAEARVTLERACRERREKNA